MILKKLNDLGKISIVLTGRVIAKNGKPPVRTVMVNDTPKVGFNLLADSVKTDKDELKYDNYYCALYCRQHNVADYQLCTMLERNEYVQITGVLVKSFGIDSRTQEERAFEEVQIHTITSITRLNKLLLQVDGVDTGSLRVADIVRTLPKGTGKACVPDDDFPL